MITLKRKNIMLTINRTRTLSGFIAWEVYSDEYLLCTFDTYYDAVEFIMTMQDIELN